jgi:hypothetical protein
MIKIKKTYKSKQFIDEGVDFESSKKTLSSTELVKVRSEGMRIRKFIELIEAEHEFTLIDGKKVLIDKNVLGKLKDFANEAEQIYKTSGYVPQDARKTLIKQKFGTNNIVIPVTYLPLVDGKGVEGQVYLTSIKKPIEMGAEGAESREAKQRAAMDAFQKLIDQAVETSGTDSINIKIGKNIVKEVIGIEEQKLVGGVKPKADFYLVRKNDTPYFLSHKDERSLQWGGVSTFRNSPDVKNFLQQLQKFYTNPNGEVVIPEKSTIGCEILSETLKMKVVFGKDFGSGQSGPNNIDAVMRGHAILTPTDRNGLYVLSAPLIMTRRGFEGFDESTTMPILTARKTGDRSDFGIKFTRIVADPIGARVVRQWLPSLKAPKQEAQNEKTIDGSLE